MRHVKNSDECVHWTCLKKRWNLWMFFSGWKSRNCYIIMLCNMGLKWKKKRNRILAKIKKNKTAIFGLWSPLIFFGCTNQGWLKGILGIFSCRLFGDHYHLTNNECQTWDICNHFDNFWTKYTAKMLKKDVLSNLKQ